MTVINFSNRAIAILATALLLAGCAQPRTVCGIEYGSYGLLNADDKKNPDVEYEVVWGNVVWSIVLMETVIAPIYFGGFSLFQPVGPKSKIKGAITKPSECSQ